MPRLKNSVGVNADLTVTARLEQLCEDLECALLEADAQRATLLRLKSRADALLAEIRKIRLGE